VIAPENTTPLTAAGSCPLCGDATIEPILRIDGTPAYQNVAARSAEEARACPRGDIVLTMCTGCGFVFNAAFDVERVRYSPLYENAQDHSATFAGYLDQLIDDLNRRHALAGKTVVEVGCGQGSFLKRLIARTGCTGVGFDPSFDPGRTAASPNATFVQAHYDPLDPRARCDVAIARHVIEHIARPREHVAAIGRGSGRGCSAICLETPRLEWIVEQRAFWDIFYEHCSYFSMPALARLMTTGEWTVSEHRAGFGGQYQWIEARRQHSREPSPMPSTPLAPDDLRQFGRSWTGWRDAWRATLDDLAGDGPCALWGAGAKGVTFLNQLHVSVDTVCAVVDINPGKQRHFIPGTAQPIVAPGAIGALGIRTVLVTNPNYQLEIRDYLRAQGRDCRVLALDGRASQIRSL
jgi:SAM-dependent methyltransferase